MSDISINDRTLRQHIRYTSELKYHRKTNATSNADQMIIRVKVSKTEIGCCVVDKSRPSHRHKRCTIAHNHTSSDKMYVDASCSDCVSLAFFRSTL